jgi:hypothetical protein
MPLYGHRYTANPRDPGLHLGNLTANAHCCGTNSMESVVTEFESSEEDYRVPTTEQVGDSPEIWESPAVASNGIRCRTRVSIDCPRL